MVPDIPDLGVGGNRRHDVGDILQGSGSGIDIVRIRDVVHYPVHWQGTVGLSQSGGPLDYGKPTPSSCSDGGGSTGGGG